MKKNGKILTMIAGFIAVGYIIGEISKYNFIDATLEQPEINLDQYLNRLTEFDLNKDKKATALFLDLIESGFYPESAFNVVQKECLEAGEVF